VRSYGNHFLECGAVLSRNSLVLVPASSA
jgi:hypothetical protein